MSFRVFHLVLERCLLVDEADVFEDIHPTVEDDGDEEAQQEDERYSREPFAKFFSDYQEVPRMEYREMDVC
uniref:Uncharacterized protein n=1 Tax=Steinernema glaseri TaxID=37863 RepID=A0A1I7ZF13_9BILA